jgi:hypothetical protein
MLEPLAVGKHRGQAERTGWLGSGPLKSHPRIAGAARYAVTTGQALRLPFGGNRDEEIEALQGAGLVPEMALAVCGLPAGAARAHDPPHPVTR